MAFERSRAGLTPGYLAVGERHIAYLEGGTGDPVILLHGFGASKDSWLRFARYLTKKYHIYAIDMPGHGDSSVDMSGDYSIPAQTDCLNQIVNILCLSRFHIFGSSMGGAIAIYYTKDYPEKVMTLGLMSSAGVVSETPSEYQVLLEHGENPLIVHNKADLNKMMRFVMVDPPFIPWPITSVVVSEYISRIQINEKIFSDISKGETFNITFLHEIKTPTFILWGEQDRVLDVSCAGILKNKIKDSHAVIMKGVGHAPMFEKPGESAELYLTFLSSYKEN